MLISSVTAQWRSLRDDSIWLTRIIDKYPAARAEAGRTFGALEGLVAGAVKDGLIAPGLADGTALVTWAFVQGLSWLLIEGPLTKVAGERVAAKDQLESALRAFKSLLAGQRRWPKKE